MQTVRMFACRRTTALSCAILLLAVCLVQQVFSQTPDQNAAIVEQGEFRLHKFEQPIGEESYRITLALAGFTPEQVTITAHQNRLTVAAAKGENGKQDYIYQSIAARPFERKFSLADHVQVEGATFDNGLLHIDLVRRVPETMKPRRIEIGPAAVTDSKARAIKAA